MWQWCPSSSARLQFGRGVAASRHCRDNSMPYTVTQYTTTYYSPPALVVATAIKLCHYCCCCCCCHLYFVLECAMHSIRWTESHIINTFELYRPMITLHNSSNCNRDNTEKSLSLSHSLYLYILSIYIYTYSTIVFFHKKILLQG